MGRVCSVLCALAVLDVAALSLHAQPVQGWRLHSTPHFLLYTVQGTPGARDVGRIAEQLEHLHAQVLAPLRLPPTQIIYPLYPSVEQFRTDWWQFATLGYGDLVHAWGTVYEGDPEALTPYGVTRAAASHAFPRAIPFLRWGLGDALGDRAAGVNPHRHLRALVTAGGGLPEITSIVAPADFGQALPASYPVAVSFMAFLIESYGPERTASFVDRVAYRYYDVEELFGLHFGAPLAAAEQTWRERIAAAGRVDALDLPAYFAATRFVYRTSLAGNPGRLLLEPQGAVVVTEAFRAALPLRRLQLRTALKHVETGRRADERAEHRQRRTTSTVRGILGALVVAPIVLAVGWLIWPGVRARLAGKTTGRRRAVGSRQ